MSDKVEWHGGTYIFGPTVQVAEDMVADGLKPLILPEPSRYSWTCSICGTTEVTEAPRIQPFCDECARRLKKLLYGED